MELAKMAAWLMADWPARRKIKWKAFIVRWLSKAQDRGGMQRGIPRGVLPGSQPPGTWLKMMKEKEAKEAKK
jgi:hypothetical protein